GDPAEASRSAGSLIKQGLICVVLLLRLHWKDDWSSTGTADQMYVEAPNSSTPTKRVETATLHASYTSLQSVRVLDIILLLAASRGNCRRRRGAATAGVGLWFHPPSPACYYQHHSQM